MKVYNTMTRRKEAFRPRSDGKVGIYVCGPTVYDYPHIGHARTYVAFDAMVRYLRFRGFKVKYIVNITNIDDKIIKRAREEGRDPAELADEFERIFLEDVRSLGLEPADAYPRVSDNIQGIVEMVRGLIRRGFAYEADGNVYFDVAKIEDFGKLSHQSLEEMRTGVRVGIDERKRNPMDFVLWKRSKNDEPGWDSPWGRGRPGWHIECSVMSMRHLGEQFDIHGGGRDLIFPHHENEIAQSEAYTGRKPFVRYWLHTGFLTVEGMKMAKSLGNFVTVRDLLGRWDPETFRLLVLQAHYRRPVEYSEKALRQSKRGLDGLYDTLADLKTQAETGMASHELKEERKLEKQMLNLKQAFLRAMDDDFNTARALAGLFGLARAGNRALDLGASGELLERIRNVILELGMILGLFQRGEAKEELPEEARRLIEERDLARKNKDWKRADAIREKLKDMGIILRDYPEGTRWRMERR
ncbi:MAG: cysteine--tRNA ligase [Candidatus Bathyarchaeia archaeon]